MKHTVYWIRLSTHTDVYSEGYVGFSQDEKRRFEEHHRSFYTVGKQIRENQEEIVFETLKEVNSLEEAKELEKHYRPQELIGWNIAPGGGGGRQPENVIIQISEKVKSYHKNKEWRENVWKPTLEKRNKNISKTMNDDKWKEEVGYDAWKRAGETITKVMNDEEWKKTKGKERIENQKKTKSSKEWKESYSKHIKEVRPYDGGNNPRAKPTMFQGKLFKTKKEAMEFGKSLGMRRIDIIKEIEGE